jgi:hypothetical protein
VTTPADPEAIARAREALEQKIKELDAARSAQPVPTPAPSVAQPSPAPTVAQPSASPTVAQSSATPSSAAPEVTASSSADIDKARDALRTKMREMEASQPKSAASATPGGEEWVTETDPEKRAKQSGREFAPLPAPPSPFSAAKVARLDNLLQKYRADQITPEVYHRERAKILAEPETK